MSAFPYKNVLFVALVTKKIVRPLQTPSDTCVARFMSWWHLSLFIQGLGWCLGDTWPCGEGLDFVTRPAVLALSLHSYVTLGRWLNDLILSVLICEQT